ncbi:hypothetical protein [Serratia oryzae]|uniref:hypothetical protein n=1 Tax=Serratia oryzae TaxID=2034155 RepID=UPI0012E12A8D|nr:hypothetical protein [Serratia oryzae]
MSNDKTTHDIEEQADALAEEILMLYVMDGMEAKEQVKQLLMQFVLQTTKPH